MHIATLTAFDDEMEKIALFGFGAPKAPAPTIAEQQAAAHRKAMNTPEALQQGRLGKAYESAQAPAAASKAVAKKMSPQTAGRNLMKRTAPQSAAKAGKPMLGGAVKTLGKAVKKNPLLAAGGALAGGLALGSSMSGGPQG